MHPMLNIAVRAARNAGNIIARGAQQLDGLNFAEKSPNDYVSEIDQRAEAEIIKAIKRAYPDHAILAEETGETEGNDFQWIIDPLDGTTNFLRGIPQYAVSIALKHKNDLEHAVVYDPIKDEMFTASRGSGAQLNGRRLRVSQRRNLKGALLGTGFPFREEHSLEEYLPSLKALIPGTAGIRRAGSAALDLAYVAAGRFDGFWEFDLNIWDLAAGALLVKEAGGLVTDMGGGRNYLTSGNVLAASLPVHAEMLERLQAHMPADKLR